MNEKIEKLAEQCGIIGGDIYEDRVVDYEKFAELIVRECAEICLEANDHKNILRHFGVE